MTKEYSPLLNSLVDSRSGQHAPDRFKAALLLLDVYSVFDIIRLPRTVFIEQLARHCDDDGGMAYDNAAGYAAQIEQLDRETGTENSIARSKRGSKGGPATSPTYSALFEDNREGFCPEDSLAAIDSPAAYLRTLYMFALQVEQTGKGTQSKITLGQRRPALKNLVIDTQNTHQQLPLLTLINETLTDHIQTWLNNNQDVYGGRPAQQVLTEMRYPFQLPFDQIHQQCVLGLGTKKPGLGALNYSISLKLPYTQQPENKYGTVQQEAYVAQCLLTRLSPAQLSLLTEDLHKPELAPKLFLKKHYGHDQPITEQQQFMLHTGLNVKQLHALLAQGTDQPRLSANVMHTADHIARDRTVGARYINGSLDAEPAPLSLARDEAGKTHLQHTSIQRLDRLQRMIRLQRWLDIPFADLDTLLHSITACEGNAQEALALTDNSLRALGVFRYLSQRYTLALPTFSAWLYQLPVHGLGQHACLFDQVFNPPNAINPPLVLDNGPLTDASLYRLCEALSLEDTPESLGLLKTHTQQHLNALKRDITTVSSFYRQSTLASLFGLSVMECDQLAHLLGGEDYRQQLVKPGLRASGSNAPADFLDVLMQLDWAVTWLKDSGLSVQQLRQQLLLDTASASSRVQLRLNQIDTEHLGFLNHLLPQASLDELDLPKPEADVNAAAMPWNLFLAKTLLRTHGLLPKQSKLEHMEKALAQAVDRSVTLSRDAERNKTLKETLRLKLATRLQSAYAQLQPFKEAVDRLLKDTSRATESADQHKQGFRLISRTFANAIGNDKPDEVLKHVLLYLPNAETDLQLPINHTTLKVFLLNPQWLETRHTSSSLLRLSLSTLYLFQRFNQCSRLYGVDPDRLISYLQLANAPHEAGTLPTLNPQANGQLSTLLGWNTTEVEQLVNRLPEKRVRSMAELDWLMRCHELSTLTGLSAQNLLLATGLTSTFSSDDWKQVANAILAAHSLPTAQRSTSRQRNDHV